MPWRWLSLVRSVRVVETTPVRPLRRRFVVPRVALVMVGLLVSEGVARALTTEVVVGIRRRFARGLRLVLVAVVDPLALVVAPRR